MSAHQPAKGGGLLLRLALSSEAADTPEGMRLENAILVALLVKLVLAVLICTGDTAAIYRFVTGWLQAGLHNPWEYLARVNPQAANFDPPPFPYPPFMLIVLGFFRSLTYILGFHSPEFSVLGGVTFKLAAYVCDIGTGTLLFCVARRIGLSISTARRALALWHLSPVSLYAIYLQGQFDIIPVFLTVMSLYLLLESRYLLSAAALSLAFATKHYALVLFCPLVIQIVRDTKRPLLARLVTAGLCGAILGVTVAVLYTPFMSPEFKAKVLHNPEGQRIWMPVYILIDQRLWMYLTVVTCGTVALLAWVSEYDARMLILSSFALLVVFTTIVAPMPGWFLWHLPFAVLLAVMVPRGTWLLWAYALFYLAYYCYFDYTALYQLFFWYRWGFPLKESPFESLARLKSPAAALKMSNLLFSLVIAGELSILIAALRSPRDHVKECAPSAASGDRLAHAGPL